MNIHSVKRLSKALLASILALFFVVGLSLLLVRFQSLAQPFAETTSLSVDKDVSATEAAPGDTLTYTITIQNSDDPAGDVWLTDTLPTELSYVSGTLTDNGLGSSFGVKENVITWTATMGGFGQTAVVTFSAYISPDITYAEIVNTAQVTGSGALIESSTSTIATTQVGNLDNQDTAKFVMPSGQAEPGDVLTYTITLNNDSGHPVPGVQVVDKLPSGLNLVTGNITWTTGSVVAQDNAITWTLDVEGYWGNIDLRFQAEVTSTEGWVTNIADISAPGHEPFTRAASVDVYQGQPNLQIAKSVYPSLGRPGDFLTYTVRIQNTGDGKAETIWMTDTLPTEVTYKSGSLTATMGSFGEAGGVVTWNVTTWPAGTALLPDRDVAISYTVQIPTTLDENVYLVNTAQITGTGMLTEVQAFARAVYKFYLYFPIMYRRWPPIPYAPILYLDDPDVGTNDYTVRWTHDHPEITVISYTLQEADNANFTGAQEYTIDHIGVENEKVFTNKPDGTYYYRVRAHNEYGYGKWSNVESVIIYTTYRDSFNDTSSGWPVSKRPIKDLKGEIHGYWYRRYRDGDYQLFIEDATCHTCDWWYQPAALAPYRPPTNKYCVETKVRFEDGSYRANMGMIFGSDEDHEKIYALCLARGTNKEKLGWFLMRKDNYDMPMFGCAGPTLKIDGEEYGDGTDRDGWNRLQVGVDGNEVKVYIGGNFKGSYTMSGLNNMTRVGVIGGVSELPPIDIRYAYFEVKPNASCAP